MSRPATVTFAYRVLLHVLSTLPEGEHVHADLIRPETEAAQLTASDKGGALRSACRDGYLTSLVLAANGEWVHASRKSTRETRDGGYLVLYTRTSTPIPEHVCQEVA